MPVNNHTSARAPAKLVAESTLVLGEQIAGLITRNGQGPFQMTAIGAAIATAELAADQVAHLSGELLKRLLAREQELKQ